MLSWYWQACRHTFNYRGRARRREFMGFWLISLLLGAGCYGLDAHLALQGKLIVAFIMASFMPALSVMIRRLHDTNRSALWLAVGLIPVLGALVLMVFFVQDSDRRSNSFGDNPTLYFGPVGW